MAEVPRDSADEIVQFGHHLNAREAAASNDKGQEGAKPLRVGLDVRRLQGVDDTVAQGERVPQVLQRKRMLCDPGQVSEARHVAQRDDEVVVLDLTRPRTDTGGSEDAPALDVDLFDLASVKIRVWAQTSNRGDGVHEADAARNYFREHRLKDHVVLSVDQRELDGPTSDVMPEKLFQAQCRIHA